MKKKVLIAGATGFIGKNLYEYLSGKDELLVDTLNSTKIDLIQEKAVEEYLVKNYYDVIIFCANYGIGRNPMNDQNKVMEYNLRMVYNFEKCCQCYGKLLYLGSGAEYDKRYDISYVCENDIGKSIPTEQYGLYKYIVNSMIRKSHNWYNLRLFGIFGKYEDWRVKYISNLCCKALLDLPLTVRQNLYFDYLWIDDFCKIVEFFINNNMQYKDYNVVSGVKVSLIELAEMVRDISGKHIPIYVAKEGLGKEYTADNKRLLSELENFEYTNIKDSIRELYEWYSNCKDTIDIYPLLYQ